MKNLTNISKKYVIIIAFIVATAGLVLLQTKTLALAQINDFAHNLPKAADKKLVLVTTKVIPVTAYNSEVGQCDSTPCITANGFNLCKNDKQNVIAANFLPFGTMVKFPDYDPDTIYTVQDRMNARYTYRADIWMKTKPEAIKFGLQKLTMEIYKFE